jgi:parvulin-like peptidyl-prolyl isomerase
VKLKSLALIPAAVILTAGEVREEILVVVNNHIITRRMFQQAVEQSSATLYRKFSGKELDEKLRDTREKVLQGMVDSFLLEDKAVDLNVSISDEQVRSYIEEIKKQNNFKTDGDFEKAIRSEMNISLADYLKQVKRNELLSMVLGREVYSKIAIEDQELRVYYEDHKDEYKQPSRFRIRELVLAKGSTPEEQQAVLPKLAEIQKALKDGKSFEELVKEYSVSPSRGTGGDLGWMGKGLMRPSIEQAALALKPGQVSQVLETDKDYMLLQLVAAEEDVVKPFLEVRPQILEKLQEPKAENAKTNYMNNLRVRANIRYQVPRDQILKG